MNPAQVTAAKHFIDKGLPLNAAVALTAVLYFESKLNPGSQGNQSTERGGALNPNGAYGIASWNGPRQAALGLFASKRGANVEALETQLDFVVNEIANSYPRSWAAIRFAANPIESVIAVLVAEYENPADHQKEIDGAIAFVGPLLEAVKDYVPAAPPAPPAPPAPGEQVFAPIAESMIAGMIKGLLEALAKAIADELAKIGPKP